MIEPSKLYLSSKHHKNKQKINQNINKLKINITKNTNRIKIMF